MENHNHYLYAARLIGCGGGGADLGRNVQEVMSARRCTARRIRDRGAQNVDVREAVYSKKNPRSRRTERRCPRSGVQQVDVRDRGAQNVDVREAVHSK